MPPLFVYAVVFLSLLVAVGFMVCLREGREPQARKAGPAAPRAALRRTPSEPYAAQPALASTRPLPHAASVAAAGPAPAEPPLRRTLLPAAAGAPAPTAPAAPPARWKAAAFAAEPAPDARAPGRTLPEPAADPLALQVAELTRQVGALKAERQSFEDEIRRLHRVVQEATAAVGEFNAARPARHARSAAPGARHISIQDLRLRRLG